MADSRTAGIEKTKNGFLLIIKGGDAATSYKAVLVFKGHFIKSKKVSNREFPDEAWEELMFVFPNNND